MPYEAAAKAIFHKANGLSAFYETTGMVGSDELNIMNRNYPV